MITIKTYSLETVQSRHHNAYSHDTEWLRKAVNKQMCIEREKLTKDEREALEKSGVDFSHFFNHDLQTGRTLVGYPLIIYHCINKRFYITGINKGAESLSWLAACYPKTFSVDGLHFSGFKAYTTDSEVEIGITNGKNAYKLIEWRPVHHDQRTALQQLNLIEKVTKLQDKLEKHLVDELGKYLGINFEGLKLEITDIARVYEPKEYKRYKYLAYDICFTANIALPPLITLGNHQALGYGRVEPL